MPTSRDVERAYADLDSVLAGAARDFLSRLLHKYLPERHGFVGDDATDQHSVQPIEPYRVLGVKENASPADIKRRVRQLAKVFHPDLPGGDADKMAEINDAARILLGKRDQ